jgi:ribosomal protein L11 methyltransferase
VRFVEIAFTVPATAAEAWAELLVDAGAGGVEERDGTTLERAPEGRTTLVAWIAPDEVDAYLERAVGAAAGLPEAIVSRRDRDVDEWRDAWKKHFGARRIGRFVIVPSWERHAAAEGEIVIDMDPGRAFGTGGHASTRLCLQALGQLAPDCRRFLDVGCGSGVLAIAAALLWPAAEGVGVDVDPDAIDVSRENAARNRVEARVRFSTDSLDRVDGKFEVVTANIQPEVLITMAPALAARLARGGRLILSGILVEAAPPVEAAFVAAGLGIEQRLDEDGWRTLVCG